MQCLARDSCILHWNDYTATFFNKGKVSPLGIMQKSYIQAFAMLGVTEELDPVMVTDIETLCYQLFSKPRITSVNMARYVHFLDNFKPEKNSEPLKVLNGVDASLFPPCKSVLLKKIKRTKCVACMTK